MTVRTAPQRADQRAHHDGLLRRLDWRTGAAPTGQPLDAIIVPASRRANNLRGIIDLAAAYGTTLVVLASHGCEMDDAARLVAGTPGARAVLAEIPSVGEHEPLRLATSAERFRVLSGHRSSNLSLKRNIGLLLARYLGWHKIMFLDDDIIRLTQDHLTRVAHHLDTDRYAGLKTLSFPDNSVVCHANRAIGRPQGIFVSGAALGVRTAIDVDYLDVFPDVYNEDWFALADVAHSTGVAHVGDVRQLQFNPYENPQRAAHEEFGDLLAEGLYALFNDGCGLPRATTGYWDRFIGERRRLIQGILRNVERGETHERVQAVKSLQEALFKLDGIRPKDCTAFLEAWQNDRRRFAAMSGRNVHGRWPSYWDAFTALGMTRWQEASFGFARASESTLPTLVGDSC